ncbi:hypothetical protein [Planctomicrobium sp. SH664]|uniref:hypothetical protein n=1 Tax=Planctomicrobium sp. SH664 TaxID=3448125 RepID=UPI003F5C64CF
MFSQISELPSLFRKRFKPLRPRSFGSRAEVSRIAPVGQSFRGLAFVLLVLVSLGSPAQDSFAQPLDSVRSTQSAPSSPTDLKGSPLAAEIPDFHLTQVLLDAQVAADRINLVITVEVVINRGEGWHHVPLRLGQAHVWQREYNGPGEEAPDVTGRGLDDGMTWMFRGLGKHQLKLSAWTPLRRNLSGGQFQLSLPPLPPQFETRLRIRIPEANAVVRSGKSLTVLDVKRNNGTTEVEASVFGSRLEFVWQTPTAGAETVSLVVSRMQLRPSAEHLSLIVEQSIELQQNAIDQLLIRLPSEFRIVRLLGNQYRTHEMLPDRPGWVRVHIVNDNAGRITLRWDLEKNLATATGPLLLDGFQVEGAIREEGLIRIDEFENARMIPDLEASDLVHRISVNQVRDWGAGSPLTAYEYLKQPFRLAFDVQPLAAYFSVDPVYDLQVREEGLELTVRCPLRIDQGMPTELRLEWPDWEQQGWRLTSASSSTGTNLTGPVQADTTSELDQIRLSWPNPVPQNVSIQAVFRRPAPASLSENFTFTLPQPTSSRTGPGQLLLQTADALEVQLSTPQGNPLAVLTSETPEPADTPASGETAFPGIRYRITPGEPITATVVVHPREILASTTVEIHEATHRELSIEQIIQLQVKYGRLNGVDLVLPPQLASLIQPYAVPESLDVWLGNTRLPLISSGGLLKATFPTPMRGHFEIRVNYSFPQDLVGGTNPVDLPVINLDQFRYTRAQCLVGPSETVQVRSEGTGWEAVRTSPRGALWINPLLSEPLTTIPLSVGQRVADSSQQYVVDRMLVRTLFNQDGSMECWTEFYLESPPSRLVIQFPNNSEFKEYLVDGMRLDSGAVTRRTSDHDELTLTLPDQVSAHPTVSVRYRTPATTSFGLTQFRTIRFPEFPRNVWVDETVWELQLPYGQHLFTYPNLVPQFQWVRHLLVWQREPSASYLAERLQTTGAGVPAEFRFESPDFYAFRGFGPLPPVTFRSMNRSLLLLIGAGFTLLLGYVFWKLPMTRNVFSLVCIAFLFAVASLWFLEPMLLLLQPAAVGLILAFTATMIDSSRRKGSGELSQSRFDRQRPLPPSNEDLLSPSASTHLYRPVAAGRSDRSPD